MLDALQVQKGHPQTSLIFCAIEIPPSAENFVFLSGNMAAATGKTLAKWFEDALDNAALLPVPFPPAFSMQSKAPVEAAVYSNKAILIIMLTDWRRGWAVIRDGLRALDLLEFSKASYLDQSEIIWRPLYPVDGETLIPSEFFKRAWPHRRQ